MKQKIAIIGAGNLGIGLAYAFSNSGYVVKLGSRNQKIAHKKLAKVDICSPTDAVRNTDLTILTVPDAAISLVCESLASDFKQGSNVLHCSGAMTSRELLAAKTQGCHIASAHPLNTFPNPEASISLFNQQPHNTPLYCEGENSTLKAIDAAFSTIGFHFFEITAEAKPLYHAACVFACNYLTVLMEVSLQTAEAAKLDRDVFWKSIQPLVQSTLTNITSHGTVNSLSGPVARVDTQTVQNHIQKLESVSSKVRNTYIDMAIHAVELAIKHDDINEEKLNKLTELLNLISKKS